MPTPATVLLSAPAGWPDAIELRKLIGSAGFVVADHALGAAPAVDFAPVAVAVVATGGRTAAAAAQTRRWRAELGDLVVPVLWLAPTSAVGAGLDAGADAVLPDSVDTGTLLAQLRAMARTQANASRVAARAAEARLLGDQLKKALTQLDREQEMARRVQATFLPKSFPQVWGTRFHVRYRTRNRTGGDFHDVRRLDEDHVGFLVGELIGSGASTGWLLGVFVQQSAVLKEITGHSYRIVPPDEVLTSVNRQLVGLGADDVPLVAMLSGVLNAKTGAVTLARAGSPPPVHLPANGAATVWAVPGPFLGAAETTYQPLARVLRPGDRLLIGTDGTRPDGAPGPGAADRLLDAVTKHRSATGSEFVDEVARELLQHLHHADDFTLLGVEMLP
ncbi:SpoIIE family protein phosphatase [Gemmata sp. JC673]|uniref:SpoIIE family protein phosphatase n=2 Tax=Gemmata algarum TaxID=2975278 RepID=A0ABU5ETH6_9BACT|nr:SpoIIE family protein phosphatase [Gemmata algarum]MDY3557922.1 SpoIIE family protein phosphatase [Gemmata algarum]